MNLSTAYDICKLSCAVLAEPVLKRIVSTTDWTCEPLVNSRIKKEDPLKEMEEAKSPIKLKSESEPDKPAKPTYEWENTNRMLGVSGYIGCKTGITPAAGPCLSACYEKNGSSFIVVLLQSKSMEDRWLEVP